MVLWSCVHLAHTAHLPFIALSCGRRIRNAVKGNGNGVESPIGAIGHGTSAHWDLRSGDAAPLQPGLQRINSQSAGHAPLSAPCARTEPASPAVSIDLRVSDSLRPLGEEEPLRCLGCSRTWTALLSCARLLLLGALAVPPPLDLHLAACEQVAGEVCEEGWTVRSIEVRRLARRILCESELALERGAAARDGVWPRELAEEGAAAPRCRLPWLAGRRARADRVAGKEVPLC